MRITCVPTRDSQIRSRDPERFESVSEVVQDASETSLVLPRNLGKNGRLLHFLLRHDFPA